MKSSISYFSIECKMSLQIIKSIRNVSMTLAWNSIWDYAEFSVVESVRTLVISFNTPIQNSTYVTYCNKKQKQEILKELIKS